MYKSERQGQIMAILKERHEVSVEYLAKKLYISASTIRRDIGELEARGLVKHYYGGAALVDQENRTLPIEVRRGEMRDEKLAIGRRAVELIEEGDVIFVDGSSTCCAMLEQIRHFKNLTVITNGQRALSLLESMNVNAFSTGGKLLRNSMAYTGRFAEDFIRSVQFDKCFFSVTGFSDRGILSDSSGEENRIHCRLMEAPGKKICLCDSSKLHTAWMYTVGRLEDVDYFICDKDIYRETGIPGNMAKSTVFLQAD